MADQTEVITCGELCDYPAKHFYVNIRVIEDVLTFRFCNHCNSEKSDFIDRFLLLGSNEYLHIEGVENYKLWLIKQKL